MLHIQRIDSFDRPELAPYRTLRYQFAHRDQGIFVAEGEKVVRRLIESRLTVVSLMLPEKWLPDFERHLASRAEDITIFVGAKELLEQLTGFTMYQGVLAVGRVPAQPGLDDLLRASPRPLLLLAADELSNAQNMGVLVRNCAAFAAHALLVGETCCSPFLRRAVRASMGTVFTLPVIEVGNDLLPARAARRQRARADAERDDDDDSAAQPSMIGHSLPSRETGGEGQGGEVLSRKLEFTPHEPERNELASSLLRREEREKRPPSGSGVQSETCALGNSLPGPARSSRSEGVGSEPRLGAQRLADTLRQLRAHGVRCIAAHPHTDRRTLPQADFRGDCCIVLGSEGQGINPDVLAQCDEAVAIPMPPDVDSLNVGSASAVFLYETARQRGRM